MAPYAQQQHDSLHASWDRRKHLNLLLFDKSNEIEEIYAGMEKPTLHGTQTKAAAIMQRNRSICGTEGKSTKAPESYAAKPKEFTDPSGGGLTVEALQTLRGRGSGGPPSPSYSNVPTELPSPNHGNQTVGFENQPDYYHPQAQYSSRPGSKPPTPKSPQESGGHTSYSAPSFQATATQRPPPTWLMPWQTGDREAGRKQADAVRKGRTPIGSFANLELALK
ncbi:hypothetical protein DUNSADRAFT_18239 [Dunaliella salina]|uniref:Encoded protein n=1 Tax=Dunaliella salina TaxID=3046 RepID=A0ABQ7GZC8_DUNSA|nr:hypothetical protein DUNSADRAFT_18239 [Dunaliella salina]|eukprot:KAF5839958.1 hypothetical protein DUNSADRAFT_18239 [Dunaliella salina]